MDFYLPDSFLYDDGDLSGDFQVVVSSCQSPRLPHNQFHWHYSQFVHFGRRRSKRGFGRRLLGIVAPSPVIGVD